VRAEGVSIGWDSIGGDAEWASPGFTRCRVEDAERGIDDADDAHTARVLACQRMIG
jgi:hypothetical protein